MVNVTAIIQARTGSSRLPGKVMYPLDGRPVLEHVVWRTSHANYVDSVVVATSINAPDDVIAEYAPRFGADVVRGSETDVLSRYDQAIVEYDPELVLRITADCPLISPAFINASVEVLQTMDVDYVSAGLERTFPRGVTCEAFTATSFERMAVIADETHHREHVTPYFREHPEKFELYNLTSAELFSNPQLQNRTDIRLTLDEPSDYELLETVYREIDYDEILDIGTVISYIDQNDLAGINEHVEQKTVK